MRRVVRLEPGHEWHETYMTLPDGQADWNVSVLQDIPISRWMDPDSIRSHLTTRVGDTVKTRPNPNYRLPESTDIRIERWQVRQLLPDVAAFYGTRWGLIGPKMLQRAYDAGPPVRRRSIPGVW